MEWTTGWNPGEFRLVKEKKRVYNVRVLDTRKRLHDLNNTFAIILSTTELLLEDQPADPQVHSDLANIRDACLKGILQVQDLRHCLGQLESQSGD